jgi:transposase
MKPDARKLSRKELYAKRVKVIELYKEGMGVMKIVACSGLSWPAVNNAIKQYKADNSSALMPAQRGRKIGTGRLLNEDQEAMICKIICTKRPWKCGMSLPYRGKRVSLWTHDAVMQLIQEKCSIKLSARGISHYLNRWGFKLTKPYQSPYDKSSKEIKEWLIKHYDAIKDRAKNEGADIYWMQRKPVKSSSFLHLKECDEKKEKIFMCSITNNQGKVRFIITKGRFTSKQQINLMQSILNESRNKVFLIRDNTRTFNNDEVKRWLKLNKEIELLPYYQ